MVFLFWFSYFKLVSHTSSSFILSIQSYEPDQVGDFQKLSSLSLAWSVKPLCPNAAHKTVQNLKQSNLNISFGDISPLMVSTNGVHSELCAVACMAFTVQYAVTCRLLSFLMTMAPAWLFPLQIHIWLSKLTQWCPVALDSLVWPPALHQRTIISHPLETHLGDLDLGVYQWCPLRKVPRKPTAPQGYQDLVPLLPTLYPSCANEANWSFPPALRGASWYIHSALTWWTVLLQLKAEGGRRASDDSIHWKGQGTPWEIIFVTHQWHSHGYSMPVSQQVAIYICIWTDQSHDSSTQLSWNLKWFSLSEL